MSMLLTWGMSAFHLPKADDFQFGHQHLWPGQALEKCLAFLPRAWMFETPTWCTWSDLCGEVVSFFFFITTMGNFEMPRLVLSLCISVLRGIRWFCLSTSATTGHFIQCSNQCLWKRLLSARCLTIFNVWWIFSLIWNQHFLKWWVPQSDARSSNRYWQANNGRWQCNFLKISWRIRCNLTSLPVILWWVPARKEANGKQLWEFYNMHLVVLFGLELFVFFGGNL